MRGRALQSSEVGSLTKFDCHIGHSYTTETMALAHFDKLERTIRAAIRCLNERADLPADGGRHLFIATGAFCFRPPGDRRLTAHTNCAISSK